MVTADRLAQAFGQAPALGQDRAEAGVIERREPPFLTNALLGRGAARVDAPVGVTDGQREITDAAVSLPARDNIVYRSDTVTDSQARVGIPHTLRIAVSATRPPAVLHRMRQALAIQPVAIGSAGAKAMAIIDGDVDAYLHAGGQWEWDSAAPAGVVMAAGMHASRLDGSPMRYNQRDPYLPDFVMCRAEVAPILLGAIRDAWR